MLVAVELPLFPEIPARLAKVESSQQFSDSQDIHSSDDISAQGRR